MTPIRAKVGDIIILKDKQSIECEYERRGVMTDGQQLTVERVRTFLYETDLGYARWTIFTFKDENVILVSAECKFNDSDVTVTNRTYFRPDAFQNGSRTGVLDNGCTWLFNEPRSWVNIDLDTLEYADVIEMDGIQCKKLMTYNGEYGGQVFLLTEWEAQLSQDQTAENPYLLALEVGDYIEFFQGCDIRDSEIEIFNCK